MNTPAQGPRAFLVGGGIAALAAAVYLLRDGHFPGASVRILEEESLGGSLDASGAAELGFSMRGSRMYGAAYELMYELLSYIPSLDDPDKSVTQDTLDFWVEAPWHDKARLVEQGRIVDAAAFGLANKDRVDLIGFMLRGEEVLGARRIDECFDAHFFTTNFWFMWRSMFGFETWHSAAELRRYLLRLTVRRDGKKYGLEFNRGHAIDRQIELVNGIETSPLRVLGDTTRRGTEVHFLADEEIFGTVEFHYEILAKRLRELSFLNNGVKIRLIDRRTGKEEDFAFAGGVQGFVEYINRAKSVLHPTVFHSTGESIQNGVPITVEVAMQWNDSYAEQVLCYTNNIPQADGGTHLTGLRAAMTRIINNLRKGYVAKVSKSCYTVAVQGFITCRKLRPCRFVF